jgi:CRISPR system Cascade subunit CasB
MEENKKSRAKAFVEYVLQRLKEEDSAFRSALRRADNPAMEYQSWEYLNRWCDLEKSWEWKPFALIGAALAKSMPQKDGDVGIGKAIAHCYDSEGKHNGAEEDAAKAKLRRLLACKTVKEACEVLRPLLALINSRGVALNHEALLDNLLHDAGYFNDRIKPRWAKDFYYRKEEV